MANLDHIKWLREGVESWNKRREKHHFFPDFSEVSIPVELRGSSYKERSPFYFSLKEINLRNANFRNASLMGLDLRKVNLQHARLQGANLRIADLRGADLIGADFSDANLQGAKLNKVIAHGTRFTGANLNGAKLRGTTELDRSDFTNANLMGAEIEGVDFRQATLLGANIAYTEFRKCTLHYREVGMGKRPPRFSKEIKSIGDMVRRWRSLENYYKSGMTGNSLNEERVFYFRGARAESWELRPSVMRSLPKKGFVFRDKEGEMLLDLMSQRPEDFIGATSALSQLVLAQHHGLKTRLLDLTRNPLVALFHACKNLSVLDRFDKENGIVHVFAVPKRLVKTFDSDVISIIANFAKLPRFEQDMLMGELVNSDEATRRSTLGYPNDYTHIMGRLYHYIRKEKPHFKERINPQDLFKVFIVEPQQSFERIKAQSGAFIISAFHERFERKEILARNKYIPVYDHYQFIVPAGSKEKISDELFFHNVRREVLFPDLDEAAEAIGQRYQDEFGDFSQV